MAKLRVKNLKQVQSNIRKSIIRAARSPDIRQGVADTVVDQIQKETSAASAATKVWRKYFSKKNKTDPAHIPDKINITFTGEQLKDLKKKPLVDTTGGKIQYIIQHTQGKHKKYKKPNGRTTKGAAKKYTEIYEYLKDMGYDYLTFSSKSKARVIKFIRANIFKNLK